jgi:hypothetical protein
VAAEQEAVVVVPYGEQVVQVVVKLNLADLYLQQLIQ